MLDEWPLLSSQNITTLPLAHDGGTTVVEVLLHGMLHQRMSSLKAPTPRHTTHRQSIRMTYKFNWRPRVCDRVDKGKGMFLYSTVLIQSVGPHKALYTFLPSQTCSLRHQLGFSRKHSSHAAITRNDVYSQVLIYTAESTGCQWREQKYQNFETVATGGL